MDAEMREMFDRLFSEIGTVKNEMGSMKSEMNSIDRKSVV